MSDGSGFDKSYKQYKLLSLVALILAIFSIVLIGYFTCFKRARNIAYINSQNLIVGFKDASLSQKTLSDEDEKWKKDLKVIEDSVVALMDRMNKEYNTSGKQKQFEMQQELSTRNQQLNNFREANMKKMEKRRAELMDGVYQKINVYLQEYGKKHRYDIIFGTVAGGSILYGSEAVDITNDVIKGLNERYQ